jgi:hypothetical protein
MNTTTENRLPSGFVDRATPSSDEVREHVAKAVAGLEAWHGEIARKRRELEREDRELEQLERELTARLEWKAADMAAPMNGAHAAPEDEDEVGGVWGEDLDLEAERWGIRGGDDEAVREAVIGLTHLADLLTTPEDHETETGQDVPVVELDAAAPGELGAEPGHEAPIETTAVVDRATERAIRWATFEDWRGITIEELLAECDDDTRDVVITLIGRYPGDEPNVGDLVASLSDGDTLEEVLQDGELDVDAVRAALIAFRAARGWDDATMYPDGIPAAWIGARGDTEDDAVEQEGTEETKGEADDTRKTEWNARLAIDRASFDLQTDADKELIYALHSYQGALNRWQALQKVGADDARLKEVIGNEFGSSGGSSGHGRQGYRINGGANPRFYHGQTVEKPTLAGKPLLDRVRVLMRVSRIDAPKKPATKPTSTPKDVGEAARDPVRDKLQAALVGNPPWAGWAKLQRDGATDAELKAAIGKRFATCTALGPDWSVKGGDEPRFWATRGGAANRRPPTLANDSLLSAARELLGIKRVVGAAVKEARPAPAKKTPAPKKVKMRVAPAAGWNRAELTAAAKDLVGRVGKTSDLLVCKACETLYHDSLESVKCPECEHVGAMTYRLKLEALSRPPTKPEAAADLLADTSHGFAPVGGFSKEDALAASMDRELLRALQLDHAHWKGQWEKIQASGATNAEILGAIKKQWPFSPVFTPPVKGSPIGLKAGYTIQGGKATGFWLGARPSLGATPDLHGNDLADAVRRVLDIKPSATKGKSPRASGAARRAKAKVAASAPKPDDHYVPEPVGKWSIVKMAEAAREILGEDHRESMRDAKLVHCLKCKAMRARDVAECPPCGSKEFVSFAFMRARVLGDGKRAVDKQLAAERQGERE